WPVRLYSNASRKVSVLVIDAHGLMVAAVADFTVEGIHIGASQPSCRALCRASTSFDTCNVARRGWPGQARPWRKLFVLVLAEQAELAGVARGLRQAQMLEGERGEQT